MNAIDIQQTGVILLISIFLPFAFLVGLWFGQFAFNVVQHIRRQHSRRP